MALDRTWVNSLRNVSSPTATDGSVWAKESVIHIYDDVDAGLPALWQGWDASWVTSNNEVVVPAQNSCRFYRMRNVLHVNLFASDLFFAQAAVALQFFLPPNCVIASPTIERYAVLLRIGQTSPEVFELGMGTAKDAYVGEVRRANGSNFAEYMHVAIHGQGFYLLS